MSCGATILIAPIKLLRQIYEPLVSMSKRSNRTLEIEQHVGSRIRQRRIMMGLTQQQLADLIGVTYQQAHKYERGINRVSAGRLFEIARVLSVPVAYLFEGLDAEDHRP